MQIWTFWEPREKMPYYLKLCIKTWQKFLPEANITILDLKNVSSYVDLTKFKSVSKNLLSGRFNFMLIADAVRAMVLEQQGGIWLDADTILLDRSAKKYFDAPKQHDAIMFGVPSSRKAMICFIKAKAKSNFLTAWTDFLKNIITNSKSKDSKINWDSLGNTFVDPYCAEHTEEIEIISSKTSMVMPDISLPRTEVPFPNQYIDYYFIKSYHIEDIESDMLFLHNSWTPREFKNISEQDFLRCDFTLANILMEVLNMKRNRNEQPIKFKTN